MKKISIIGLLSILFICACSEDELPAENVVFEPFGLEGKIINKLKLVDQILMAATNDGIYSKNINDSAEWNLLGLDNYNVSDFDVKNSDIIATTISWETEEYKLFRSANEGESWNEIQHNFGGEFPEPVFALKFHPTENKLFGAGYRVISISEDLGQSWQVVFGEWGAMATGIDFIQVNPATNDIWAGGQNAIEDMMLFKIGSESKEWLRLLPSPSVAKDIAFHPVNSNEGIVGAESGIIKTSNGGEDWTAIKENHEEARFYFGVNYDQQNPNIIYAGSWIKNFDAPQPLILFISKDGGGNWVEFKHNDPGLFGGVWDMITTMEKGQVVIYMGLYKGGVYKIILR
ncbi:MAG: hypothetical protein ACNS60_08720 [Candidatus Cyclobacteriaceae bacterium M2_1C_046]